MGRRVLARLEQGSRVATAVAMLAVAMTATACGSDGSAAQIVEVQLGSFTITPPVVTVNAGEVELEVVNVDPSLVHNLVAGGKGTRSLAPGERQTLSLGEVEPGEYRMWCDIPGHAQAGQVATLVVGPSAQ